MKKKVVVKVRSEEEFRRWRRLIEKRCRAKEAARSAR